MKISSMQQPSKNKLLVYGTVRWHGVTADRKFVVRLDVFCNQSEGPLNNLYLQAWPQDPLMIAVGFFPL